MALANFFDKAALAASQLLQGYDYSAFREQLLATTVGLAFGDQAAGSSEGKITLELSANLLARLYPTVALLPNGPEAERLLSELVALMLKINPDIELVDSPARLSVCLAVGDSPLAAPPPAESLVNIGSDGWCASLDPDSAVGSGNSNIPFGAAAAACIGVANVFRIIFGAHLPGGAPDKRLSLSLLDYSITRNGAVLANPALGPVDFGKTYLVGLGAIGNGAIWTLSKMRELQGRLHLVDDETLDLTNLQRYVLATQAHLNPPVDKVLFAAEALKETGLVVAPHPTSWGQYQREAANWYLERVAVALDSAEARCAVQASLPKWLVNSWTQQGDLGISRHDFAGEHACLVCLYMPEGGRKNEDVLVAEAIGLPGRFLEVRELLYTRAPVTRQLLQDIAAAFAIPLEPLLQFEGQPLKKFYSGAICAGLVLSLGGEPGTSVAEVPMAFQSTMAGVMLAAELVAHAAGIRHTPLAVTTKIDLLRPLGTHLSVPATKHPSGRCICQDPDYAMAYRAKYGA